VEKVEIIKMDSKGRGMGRLNDKPIFIFNSLPGEVVEIKNIKERRKYILKTSVGNPNKR